MADAADQSQAVVDAEIEAGQREATYRMARRGTQVCIGCGEEIDPRRRQAAPWATRCVECQIIADRRGSCGG